ncbi:MAG: hypothetical protein DME26_10000, partial [Verrucomicrobia bacterium]
LEPNVPDGARIDSQSGLFTWQPTEDQGPGLYTIVVKVADNGSPALSASRSFRVTVNEVNSAPVLAPIADQTVSAGTLLSFAITATDPDLPPQKLTFTLDPGAPAGAAIDAMSGLFTWTPAPAQAPSVNPIIVRVTDDGPPPLDQTRTFTVVVSDVPSFSATAAVANNIITIGWQTVPGKTYQVQYSTELSSGSWQVLGADVNATGSSAS